MDGPRDVIQRTDVLNQLSPNLVTPGNNKTALVVD